MGKGVLLVAVLGLVSIITNARYAFSDKHHRERDPQEYVRKRLGMYGPVDADEPSAQREVHVYSCDKMGLEEG